MHARRQDVVFAFVGAEFDGAWAPGFDFADEHAIRFHVVLSVLHLDNGGCA